MTSSEKELLRRMRQDGKSYSQIATALGLSENTIKSYCRRASIQTEADVVCLFCRQPFPQLSQGNKRRFCSNTCRYAWNYAHRILGEKNAVAKYCAYCGKSFFSYSSGNRKYCSRTCYIYDRFGKELSHDPRSV